MYEGIDDKNERGPEDALAKKLAEMLQDRVGDTFELQLYEDTYEIDSDIFSLTFTVSPDVIELRSIEAKGARGVGSSVVRAIQEFAAEEGLAIIASNVLDTAVGFWQRMDFQPTNKDGEYMWEG